jgi:NET1-associated nuclear protein 1 (U3 small nucleolar RNA-associated protein 17)
VKNGTRRYNLPSRSYCRLNLRTIAMAEANGTQKLKRKRNGAEPQRKKVKTESAGPKDVAKPLETGETTDGASSTPLKKPNATPKSKKEHTPTPTSKSTPKQTPQRSQPDGTDATPSTSTKTRKDKKRNNVEAKAEVRNDGLELAVTKGSSTVVAANGEHVERSSKKEKKQRKHKDKSADQWSVSSPLGGWFLPQDPVFSLDEKYLLLAKPNAVEVYATETSLLARELPVGGSASIVSYCISSVQPDQLYIADSIGMITLWNWTNGRKVGRWDLGTNVWHQTIVKQPGAKQDLLYAHEASSKSHVINVHALRTGAEASETELKHILKTSNPITGIQVHLEGKIVVVSTAKSVIVGKRIKFQKTAVQDFEYVWREFEMSDRITTFSSHVRLPDIGKGKRPQADPRDHLDLAIGDSEGVIHLFEDILSSFAAVEKSQHNKIGKEVLGPESLRPKRLHWHREAVGAVKWSLDGALYHFLIQNSADRPRQLSDLRRR